MPFPPPRKRTNGSLVATVWALQEEPACESPRAIHRTALRLDRQLVHFGEHTIGMPWTPVDPPTVPAGGCSQCPGGSGNTNDLVRSSRAETWVATPGVAIPTTLDNLE